MVPYFKSLADFVICRNLFMRSSTSSRAALAALGCRYMIGMQRSDSEERLRRHFKDSYAYNPPDFLFFQNRDPNWYRKFRYPH